MIEFRKVAFGRRDQRLFDGLDWQIEDPGRYLLLGENGAGKSTICGLLSGVLKPAGGNVEIDGEPAGRGAGFTCFSANARDVPPEGESVWEYLQVELQNAGPAAKELPAAWAQVGELLPENRETPLTAISHGQYLLLHVLLASLIPTRIVLLDGHLTYLNQRYCTALENLLVNSPVTQDRFVVFTSNRFSYFLPRMDRSFALSAAAPHLIDALDAAEYWTEHGQGSRQGLLRVVFREQWINSESLVSGTNFQLVSRADNLLLLKLTGTLDGLLEELVGSGITPIQLVWEQ